MSKSRYLILGRIPAWVVSTFALAMVSAGCACHCPPQRVLLQPHPPIPCGESSLVFNPEWTGILLDDFPRDDWPVAYGRLETREDVAYRELILDRQGWTGYSGDRLNRAFTSTRTGRARH